MSRDGKDTVYCNIQMPLRQGHELLQLVAELRESGKHFALDSILNEMQRELISSIEFVEEQLAGVGG